MSLIIDNVSKAYGEKKVLADLSLSFADKGLYLLTGESGRGKTTLLRIIAGLDTDFSGEVTGGGIGKCSYAFQEYRLFPALSAVDNVLIASFEKPTEENRAQAQELLRKMNFTEKDMDLRPSELSGGMKQRVSLARALLKKTPVLLLDEPTKELDGELVKIITEMIRNESENRLVIAVTHQADDFLRLGCEEIRLG